MMSCHFLIAPLRTESAKVSIIPTGDFLCKEAYQHQRLSVCETAVENHVSSASDKISSLRRMENTERDDLW